ncbi:MAG: IPTL-CTERM sorting domain-containing protein [Planctomycetes bacterium]|nr:IPTL-CTERM sorting domain-containing protein [Planctomycetota bacterium]
MNHSRKSRIGVVVLAAVSLGWFADVARPCVEHDPAPPDIWIKFQTPRIVWITLHGYQTFGSSAGQFCTCALNQIPAITSVDLVEFREPGSGNLISEFLFAPDGDSDFGGGITWAGFSSSPLQSPVAAGIPVDVLFRVNVVPGTSFVSLANDLSGAGNVIGTDEADSNGFPTGAHQIVLPAGPIMSAPVPTVSEWGLIIMTLLLLTGGTIVLGRRRTPVAA